MSRRRPVNVQVHLRRNETQEHMIKRFMKKVKNERIIEEYRENEFFEKPSVINARKRKRRKNVYKKLRMQQESLNTNKR